MEVHIMLEHYLSDLPQNDSQYFHDTVKKLPNAEKEQLIRMLLAMNKNHMVEGTVTGLIHSLVRKGVLVPCLEVKPNIYTFWVMPDYPYLTTQLGKFLVRHYAKNQ
jgi:hypothetical protein